MRNFRLIARLDIKSEHLIKGVQLEGLRKLGEPHTFAVDYYKQGIDELLYMDSVASLYNRFSLRDLISRTMQDVFVPVTVGGGLRTLEDVRLALKSGADKVAVNTAAIRRPEFITEVANEWGAQVLVLSIEAIRQPNGGYKCFTDNAREHTGRETLDWVQEAAERGVGEFLITSVDKEGTAKGIDAELCAMVSRAVQQPVIYSGGVGAVSDIQDCIESGADAVALAHVLHYKKLTVPQIRESLVNSDARLRAV